MMQTTSYHAGLAAEETVANLYRQTGHVISAQRLRTSAGEIDLVAEKDGEYIFIEVKQSKTHARAAERIGRRQMARICSAAEIFMHDQPGGSCNLARFDAALVDQTGRVEIIENAFAA